MRTADCGAVGVLLVRQVTGAPRVVTLPCGNWACAKGCGHFRAILVVNHLTSVLRVGATTTAWWSGPMTKAESGRATDRASFGGEYIKIHLRDGVTYMVSSVNLGGKMSPRGRLLKPDTATEFIRRHAFSPPCNVLRVDWSDGWRPTKAPKLHRRIGMGSADEMRAVLARAQELFKAKYGRDLAEGVDPAVADAESAVTECLDVAWAEIMGPRRARGVGLDDATDV